MYIAPIETVYNGYRFRSRLEARWAVFFDTAGIKYVYEPEGFTLSDGTKYLPDFYLPDSKTWFEAKGVMTVDDLHKIEQFQKDMNARIVIGNADMSFQASDDWWGESCSLAEYSQFVQCWECMEYFFMGTGGSYKCPCCGYYDGDSGFIHREDRYEAFVTIAKQARFEHGETPGQQKRTEKTGSLRYRNIRLANAVEGVISLVIAHPELLQEAERRLSDEDPEEEPLIHIWKAIKKSAYSEDGKTYLVYDWLTSMLSADEVRLFLGLRARVPEGPPKEMLDEYLTAAEMELSKIRGRRASPEDLAALLRLKHGISS